MGLVARVTGVGLRQTLVQRDPMADGAALPNMASCATQPAVAAGRNPLPEDARRNGLHAAGDADAGLLSYRCCVANLRNGPPDIRGTAPLGADNDRPPFAVSNVIPLYYIDYETTRHTKPSAAKSRVAGGQAAITCARNNSNATAPPPTTSSDATQAGSNAAWADRPFATGWRSPCGGTGADGGSGSGSGAAGTAAGSGAGGGAGGTATAAGATCGSAKSVPQREQRSVRPAPASSRSGTSYSAPQDGQAIRMRFISTGARRSASSG